MGINISERIGLDSWPSLGRRAVDNTFNGLVAGGLAGVFTGALFRRSMAGAFGMGIAGALIGGAAGFGWTALDSKRTWSDSQTPPDRNDSGISSVQEGTTRIMTINIRTLRGQFFDRMEQSVTDAIVGAINSADPDVVVLQEVDSGTSRSRGEDQVQMLSGETGATDSAFVAATAFGGGHYGQGVLLRNGYRFDAQPERIDLEGSPQREQRIAVKFGVVSEEGKRATVIGTHLATHGADNNRQRDQLAELAAEIRGPVIIAGDLNAQREKVRESFEPAGFNRTADLLADASGESRKAEEPWTFRGVGTIDHILVNDKVEVTGQWTTSAGVPLLIEPATDHRAVVSDLVINDQYS